MSGVLLSPDNRFRGEKREFWFWPVFLIGLVITTIMFGRSYRLDREVQAEGKIIHVKVMDKINGYKRHLVKIGTPHGSTPIQVKAGSRWFKSTKVGEVTTVRYSSKHNAYLDPYHLFGKDQFFLGALILMDLVVLWRAIWLGLYIWYWK